MANLSAIKLPNGTTYNLKDSVSGYTTNTGTITKVQTTAGAHTTINVSSGAASFNVPTKTSHLTNDSGFLTSHQTLYEANLNWGGKDFSAGYSPIDAAMIDVLGANRFAFLKAAGLTIEYSTNGGSSYTDYGATDAQKVGLFSSGQGFYLGKHTSNGSCTTNDRLRVTIATSAAGIYTVLNKIAIYMSTSGATVQVLIERALESTPTTFQTHKDWTNISGWSGWNILNISGLTTYGNTASSQYGRIRFTFRQTAVNTNYTSASISKIMGFGGVGWTVPSTMAATGHLYSYDSSQNATFPAKVTASGGFSGNLTGNVIGNVSGTASNVTDTVAIANGGTGQTTAANAINALLNGLPVWTADPTDTTYFVRQDTGGAASYGKVAFSTIWNYIGGKLPSWSKASTKPTYTASEVGALPSTTTYVSTVTTTAGAHTAISSKSGAVSFNVPTKTSHLTNDSGFITGITAAMVKTALGTGSGTTKFLREDGSWATPAYIANTDAKLQVAEVTSATQYYPLVGTGTTAATRQYDTTGFKYKGTTGTTSAVGSAILELGNSTASGTAGNKQGQLIMYGTNAKKATITLAAPSADIALALPTSGGTLALTSQIPSVPTSTGSSATGITASTTATKTTLGTAFTIPNVTSAGSASTWVFEEISVPNVTSAGSASSWTFEEKTIPNVTSAGSASTWAFTGVTVANSISGAVDANDSTQLNITLGTTTVQSKSSGGNGTAPTLGTAIKVQSKSGGSNGSAPTLGTAIKVQSKKSGGNGTAPSLGTAFTVPNVTGNTTGSVTITDNGHTHTIG